MPKCILHVENDEGHARLIDATLKSEGYDVIEARNHADAKAVLSQSAQSGAPRIDGLLADLNMRNGPIPSGVDAIGEGAWFLYWLRQQVQYVDLPVIVLSAYAEEKRIPGWKHILRIGDVVMKPISGRLLTGALLNTFGRP